MKEFVKEIVNRIGFKELNIRNFKDKRSELEEYTINNNLSCVHEAVFCLYNDKIDIHKCYMCENKVSYKGFKKGYCKTCSKLCQSRYAASKTFSKLNDEERKEMFEKQKEKRRLSLLDKYGVDNIMKVKEIASKNHIKMRQTNINSGRWLNYDNVKNDFSMYYKKVWYITNAQNISTLENIEKRAHISKSDSYHLDHMFSIKQAFLENIPVWIIGNISNLEMICGRQNLSKQDKCSISKEELFREFFK